MIGFLCGTLLLAFAGTLAFVGRSELSGSARRLQLGVVGPVTSVFGFANFTTTAPSSLDSSDSSSFGSSLESSKSSESESFKSGGTWVEQAGASWGAGGGTTVANLFIMLLFACLYKKKGVDPVIKKRGTLDVRMQRIDGDGHDDFENTICECFNDKWVCIHGLCCPLARMAHTNAVAGVMGFWETAFCWCCCSFWSMGLGPCCLMVWFRMRLKAIMKIEDHCFNDFLVTLFCPMLAICQQGTAVDTAMGYEVTGCCDLEFSHHDHHDHDDRDDRKW
jgi:Cys-rich protein (TIGR01571 family)